jgi:cobalt-zinc-cadmium efflux system outer membrane protein
MEDVFTFTQRIPWPTKLLHAGNVAEEGARIAALLYSSAVRDVLVDTRISYLEYGYLTRARSLVEQNVAIAERLAGLGEDLFSKDEALLMDVLKAQSQLAQLRYDLITLAELTSAERTRLNALMDRPPEAPLGAPSAAPFPRVSTSIEELYELASRYREELRIADRRIEQARAKEALAASQFAPDLTIGATYVRIGENRPPIMVPPDSGQDASGVMLGLTIPLWVNRHTAEVREARADRDAAILAKAQAWDETFSALKDAYFKLTNAERLVLLYRDSLVPQAEQVLLSAEERAREDRMRLGDYLEAQTVWLNFTLARERALVDHDQAIARIERLTGTVLTPAPERDAER